MPDSDELSAKPSNTFNGFADANGALQAAEEAIREQDPIALSARDSRIVVDALLNPGPDGPALRRVAEQCHTVLRQQ